MRIGWLAVALAVAASLAAAASAQDGNKLVRGEHLYGQSCIRCHGANGAGIVEPAPRKSALEKPGLGPPLRGVGALAADF